MNDEPREIACTGIFLATPNFRGALIYPFYDSMIATLHWLSKGGVPYAIATSPGDSIVARARNSLVASFMASSCSHLLFIDDDLSWDAQSVTRLLAVDKDMVCGLYPKKELPVAWPINIKVAADLSVEREAETGLVEITHAPTGFLMIRRTVIERMIAAYPQLRYNDKSVPEERRPFTYALFDCELRDGEYWGEDFTFSHRWRAIGGRIWLDPSIRLKHHGAYAYEGDPETMFRSAPVLAAAAE